MNPLIAQLRDQEENRHRDVIQHLDWLDTNLPGSPGNLQGVMAAIDLAAQKPAVMPPAPPPPAHGDLTKEQMIDEAISTSAGEFSTTQVFIFLSKKYPTAQISRKYIGHVLAKKCADGSLEVTRKGIAGNPNYYRKIQRQRRTTEQDRIATLAAHPEGKNLSSVNGEKKAGTT